LSKISCLEQNKIYSIHYAEVSGGLVLIDIGMGRTIPNYPVYRNAKALGLQYGLCMDKHKCDWKISAGLSYVEISGSKEKDNLGYGIPFRTSTVGIPITIDLNLLTFKNIGLKANFYWNINPERSFYLITLGIMLGKLR